MNIIAWGLKLFFHFPEKIRFLLVGGFNTVVGYIIFVILYFFLQNYLHYSLILLIQFMIAVNISYLTMKFFVFRTKKNYKSEYPKTILTYIGVYFVNLLLLAFLQRIIENIYFAQFIAISMVVVITYMMHKYINYR